MKGIEQPIRRDMIHLDYYSRQQIIESHSSVVTISATTPRDLSRQVNTSSLMTCLKRVKILSTLAAR